MTVMRRPLCTCSNAAMLKPPAPWLPAPLKRLAPGAGSALRRTAVLAALGLGSGLAVAVPSAADGAQLMVDHGCMNCHSNASKTAPPLNRLAEKMARKGDQPDALQPVLRELRGQTAIHGHQTVSDASLLAILQWLAQGAK